jgi:hypothetical protein
MQLNVGAQLWSELALLPDLFDLSSSFGYSSLPDQSIVSSFLANPSQRSAPNCVLSGEDSGTNDGNFALESVDQGRHFMCLAVGRNMKVEVDPPAGSAAPSPVSPSGSGELPLPSGTELHRIVGSCGCASRSWECICLYCCAAWILYVAWIRCVDLVCCSWCGTSHPVVARASNQTSSWCFQAKGLHGWYCSLGNECEL